MPRTDLFPSKLIELGKWVDYRDPIWGDSYNWSWARATHEVEWLVYHHTVTSLEATPNDIALLHKARGWGGIGYHFVITPDGVVYYVGDVSTARANVLNKNEKVIGIALIGNFMEANPTDEQIISAHYLGKYFLDLAAYPQLKTWDGSVKGHKELQATACPGRYWRDVPGISDTVYERIKNKIPYSPVTPPTPEPIPEEPQPDDPCLELRNKHQQLQRDYANLLKEHKNADDKVKTLTTDNANLVIANEQLKRHDVREIDKRLLVDFTLARLFNRPLPIIEEASNE